jgi:TPR repeat protein
VSPAAPTPVATAAKTTRSAASLIQDGNAFMSRRDYASAVRTFSRAADMGDVSARDALGTAYQAQREYAAAMAEYQAAANKGSASAERHIGLMYWKGLGVAKDMDRAYDHLKKAARQGDTEAQEDLRKAGQKWE